MRLQEDGVGARAEAGLDGVLPPADSLLVGRHPMSTSQPWPRPRDGKAQVLRTAGQRHLQQRHCLRQSGMRIVFWTAVEVRPCGLSTNYDELITTKWAMYDDHMVGQNYYMGLENDASLIKRNMVFVKSALYYRIEKLNLFRSNFSRRVYIMRK